MKNQVKTTLDKYLDDGWACAYENRIPEGWSSRNLAFLPILCGILFGGMGVFMAHDAAMEKVPFWSNPAVLFGIGLSFYCNFIGLAMFVGKWGWTALQMGALGICGITFYYSLSVASLTSTLLYGNAPLRTTLLIAALSLIWNGYWAYRTVQGCRAIWADELLRQRVWVNYRNAVVYRQFGAKAGIEQLGIKIHPNSSIMIFAIFLIAPLTYWYQDLSRLFGVSFVHVLLALFGQVVMVLGLVVTVLSFMLMIYYPLKIKRETGKSVLLDMVAPANAPIPNQSL